MNQGSKRYCLRISAGSGSAQTRNFGPFPVGTVVEGLLVNLGNAGGGEIDTSADIEVYETANAQADETTSRANGFPLVGEDRSANFQVAFGIPGNGMLPLYWTAVSGRDCLTVIVTGHGNGIIGNIGLKLMEAP